MPHRIHLRTHQDRLADYGRCDDPISTIHNPPSLRDLRKAAKDGTARRCAEISYRRGYLHGYCQAMDDLRAGCRSSLWHRVCSFFDGALSRWRYGDCEAMSMPPACSDRSAPSRSEGQA